jgi:CRP-like cAMP-binding protein
VLGGDLDFARRNPEQRLAVDDEPGQRRRRYTRGNARPADRAQEDSMQRSSSSARLLPVARSATVDTSRFAAFSVLADLPAAELDELAAAMSEVDVEAGVNVITLDNYGTTIYFIEQGEADVLTGDEAAQILGPGDMLGEIGLLLTGERTATVVARTPMRLLSLSGQDFQHIRARVPELERSLRRLGVERAGG